MLSPSPEQWLVDGDGLANGDSPAHINFRFVASLATNDFGYIVRSPLPGSGCGDVVKVLVLTDRGTTIRTSTSWTPE